MAAAKTIAFDDPQDQGFWCAVTRVQIPPLAPLAHGSKRPTAWEVLNSITPWVLAEPVAIAQSGAASRPIWESGEIGETRRHERR